MKNDNENGKVYNKCYMLGVLAEGEPHYPVGFEQKPITIISNKSLEVIFYIKAISLSPKDIRKKELFKNNPFIGFASRSFRGVKLDPLYKHSRNMFERIDIVEKKIKNKLILFEPRLKKENKKDITHKNMDIISVEELSIEKYELIKDNFYMPIPGLTISRREFERLLKNKQSINFSEYSSEMPEPQIVYCEHKLYLLNKKEPRLIDLPANFKNEIIYKYNDNLQFISKEYYDSLLTKEAKQFSISKIEREEEIEEQEQMFLEDLYQKTINKNLYYQKEDIYNLHTSIKTGGLTIISGMSGTGKTKLAQAYAEALGLKYNLDYIIIPISPSYTEPNDLLGYYNVITNSYMPAETGLVDILVKAENNQDRVYLIIFDEMNLSQIEYWFSPFISLLELDKQDRLLKLYNEKEECKKDYPPTISLGDNLIILGTVNIDETTKDFSDRLLDRVNLISLNKLNFADIKVKMEKGEVIVKQEIIFNDYYHKLINWHNNGINPITVLKKEELQLLDNIHQAINVIEAQKGVSFRVLDNIARYLTNIPTLGGKPLISRQKAFDLQVKQRILTKLKGHQQQFGDLIGIFDPDYDDNIANSIIYNILTTKEAQVISDFTLSIAELKRKAKEMYYNGYAT